MRVSVLLCLALAACSHDAVVTTPEPATTSAPASRQLGAESTFAELVARAQSLEAAGDAESTARCVIARRTGGYSLAAPLAPAIRPLPEAQDRLAERLMQGQSVRVLSRWGARGAGALALVTITASAPLTEDVKVVLVTPRGMYLRTTTSELPERTRGAWSLSRFTEGLASLEIVAGETIVVTSEASMAVSVLADVLTALSALDVRVVLAVALPEGTPIPDEPAAITETGTGMCEALPPLPAAAVEGELTTDALRAGAGALPEMARACAHSASSLAVARGGRVELLLRIGPSGHVEAGCVRADEIGDDAFRQCLIGASRQLRFAAPTQGGFVDFAVPVRLRPDTSDALTPICLE